MAKALRGEAVVKLPRTLKNAGHGSLRFGPEGEIFSECSSNLEDGNVYTRRKDQDLQQRFDIASF